MVLDGLRVGALRFAIDRTNQESNTVCVYVYLGNEQAYIDGNKRAPLLTPRTMTAFPPPFNNKTRRFVGFLSTVVFVLYDTKKK